jgi:ATP-binding protein involved in chromosome partitioning
MAEQAALQAAIGAVEDPLLHRSLDSLGMVREVAVGRVGKTRIEVALVVPNHPFQELLTGEIEEAAAAAGAKSISVEFTLMTDDERSSLMERLRPNRDMIGGPGTRTRVIGISSGKGGVGKSSVTSNLAVALTRLGHSVGVIDADVWGFSVPKMMGAAYAPIVVDESMIAPETHGVKVMSMDYFVADDQAVIWRGPMLHKAMEQFLVDVFWDDPDFLLIDMPPGTGDIAISLSQFLPRAQALVVTTPQPAAQRVAKRAALMAEKVNQEVLGVVENMSWFTGDDGKRYQLFGEGGGAALAAEIGCDLLGQIPLVPAMREGADDGRPVVVADPGGEADLAFQHLAEEVVARKPRIRTHPDLVIK